MKVYTKLKLPQDSAWQRKTWRRYTPIWFNEFVDGLRNLIDWLPTIWKDRHWDDYYITKILQRKIELQRAYLVHHNRHTNVDRDNRDMTWALNLIERKHEDYYQLEKYDYEDSNIDFVPVDSASDSYTVETTVKWENWDGYLVKYKGAVRRVLNLNPKLDPADKETLTHVVGRYNQERSNRLLWKIMSERSESWWD